MPKWAEMPEKWQFQENRGKSFESGDWQTGSVGSSETQVFFFLNKLYRLTNEIMILGSAVAQW